MNRTNCTIIALVMAVATLASAQTTWHVPGGQPTIQAGIDAAVTGDTVIVAAGTYHENLVIQGKEIELRSVSGATATIVDGDAVGPVIMIGPGLGRALLISGFTLTDGRGADVSGVGSTGLAGGIEIAGSSPSLEDCRIIGNHGGDASDWARGGAGGIACVGPGPDPGGLAIRRCLITGNSGGTTVAGGPEVLAGQGGAGGIMIRNSNFEMRGCQVRSNGGGNSWFADNHYIGAGGGGGGIEIESTTGVPQISDSEISGNHGGAAMDGMSYAGAGGIHGGSPEIRFCVIEGNHGGLATGWVGSYSGGPGGLFCGAPKIFNTIVRSNTGGDSGLESVRGGAGGLEVGGALIVDSLIVYNVAGGDGALPSMGSGGGGIHALGSNLTVVNCTVVGNRGGDSYDFPGCGGIHNAHYIGGTTIANSIVWNNIGGSGQIPAENEIGGIGATTVSYCDVKGGMPGTANMDVDPLLVGDFHLAVASLCREAGDSLRPELGDRDVDGDPRLLGGAVDIGADEYNLGLYPGTAEDLSLETVVNYGGRPGDTVKFIRSGNILDVRMASALVSFSPANFWLLGSPFPTGTPPAASPGFPGFQLNPLDLIILAPGPTPISDGGWPQGRRWFFLIGPSFPGWSLMVQGFAVDASAMNGWFAATEAHELRFD